MTKRRFSQIKRRVILLKGRFGFAELLRESFLRQGAELFRLFVLQNRSAGKIGVAK